MISNPHPPEARYIIPKSWATALASSASCPETDTTSLRSFKKGSAQDAHSCARLLHSYRLSGAAHKDCPVIFVLGCPQLPCLQHVVCLYAYVHIIAARRGSCAANANYSSIRAVLLRNKVVI